MTLYDNDDTWKRRAPAMT